MEWRYTHEYVPVVSFLAGKEFVTCSVKKVQLYGVLNYYPFNDERVNLAVC